MPTVASSPAFRSQHDIRVMGGAKHLEHFDCWHNYDMGCSTALPDMSIVRRHNLNIVGNGRKTMVLAHGYGCDQIMWRFLVPAFQNDYRLVLFDHIGAGKSDLSYYSRERYGTLNGYADDLLDIIEAVSGRPVIFVGHSVSAMIGVLAASKMPASFERLVLIGPSPCYINQGSTSGDSTRAT